MTVLIHSLGQGKPLVFFHGWGFSHKIWLPLAHQLRDRFQLFLVDLPGTGATPISSWEVFKEALLQQLPPRFVVVGWSLGGLYAMRLAIEEPARVDQLIAFSSSPRFIQEHGWPGVPLETFRQFFVKLKENPLLTLADFVALQSRNQYIFKDACPRIDGLEHGLTVLETWDLRNFLPVFTKPASFLFGRLDSITPPETIEAMQALYPQFEYRLIKKASHMPFLSHEQEVIAFLDETLK